MYSGRPHTHVVPVCCRPVAFSVCAKAVRLQFKGSARLIASCSSERCRAHAENIRSASSNLRPQRCKQLAHQVTILRAPFPLRPPPPGGGADLCTDISSLCLPAQAARAAVALVASAAVWLTAVPELPAGAITAEQLLYLEVQR